jgi:hydroxymethylpyrimidine/phosphomethylpyrimidine kinase / thiaminase
MLASTETIRAVAQALEAHNFSGSLVVDPVMVATTGAKLLPSEALRELRERLLPRATVLTPNIPEARLLLSDAGLEAGTPEQQLLPPDGAISVADLEAAGNALLSLGPEWVLIKGGHAPMRRGGMCAAASDAEKEVVVDVLCGKGSFVRIETEYQASRNTHGTGCSLACEFVSLVSRVATED